MKTLNDRLVLLPYVLLFGSLALVGCVNRALHRVDTTPVAQGLSAIDKDFEQVQKEVSRKQIAKIAQAGRAEVASTQKKLALVQVSADKVIAERDWWKADSESKDAKIIADQKIIAKRDHKLNLLGFTLATVSALFVFNLLGMVTPLLTPMFAAYSFAGRLVVAGLVFAAVFSWVRFF
jgi:hypothetical protein